ncbi:MAG: hypothetical protein M1832_000902 [Thelocarpon impressellum]|nr:MAG: hypothetical protein M1832_000902 [Thelocarpon impressellum]
MTSAPSSLQPRPKAPATSNATGPAAPALPSGPESPPLLSPPTSSSSTPAPRAAPSAAAARASERATALLIRRTLCAHHAPGNDGKGRRATPRPLEELLPPLTSSNEVDLQLYALIAVIVRDFIHPWYAKITPDKEFVEELVQLVAHCTRGLEQRFREVDLEGLLLDEVPELVNAHLLAYRASHRALHPPPLSPHPWEAYHALHPHPALSPVPLSPSAIVEQRQNETAYRKLLVQRVLAVLLPAEDLENDCLRTLVEEIVAETIIGNVLAGKACEGYVWWQGISRLLEAVQQRRRGIVLDDERGLPTTTNRQDTHHARYRSSISALLQTFAQALFLLFISLRFALVAMAKSYTLPSRSQRPATPPSSSSTTTKPAEDASPPRLPPRAILAMRAWTSLSLLLDLPARMPGLRNTLVTVQSLLLRGPGRLGAADGLLDKLIAHHLLGPHVLSPRAALPPLLLALRQALAAPAPPPPTPAEALQLRRDAALALLSLLGPAPPPPSSPPPTRGARSVGAALRAAYTGAPDAEAQVRVVEETVLDPLGADAYCLRHLVYATLEAVLGRVVPEAAFVAPRHEVPASAKGAL